MTFDPTSLPYLNPAKDRRVALVTGGNSGVGFFTVLHLYLHGYIVYIGGRNGTRVLKTISELQKRAHKIRSLYLAQDVSTRFIGELFFLEIDLANLQSVVRGAQALSNLEKSLHILMNNAGAMAVPYSVTKDGFEIQLQTNFISPFVLTTKLLPLLERTAELHPDIGPPRILYLSSIGHQVAFRYFNMNSSFNYWPNFLFTWFRYASAKTAGIHYMKMLALRNPRILSMAVHPGLIMNTNIFAYWTSLPIIGIFFWVFFSIFGLFFGTSMEKGAYTALKCCLDPSLNIEQHNGKYFAADGKVSNPSRVALNMDYAARTWIWAVHKLSERNIDIPA